MNVIYSTGFPFNYPGNGKIAYYACSALYKEGMLKRILAPCYKKSEIEDELIDSFPLNPFIGKVMNRNPFPVIKDSIYDRWASGKVTSCNAFYGWSHQSLYSLRRAKKLGALTFIDRGSAEATWQKDVLDRELKKEGISRSPINNWNLNRMIAEQEEVDYIVVPSNFVKNTFLERGYAAGKVIVNHLGIDTSRFSPNLEKRSDGAFRVLFMGILSIQKGVNYLLRAWNKLGLANAELVLVGQFDRYDRSVISNLINNTKNVRLVPGTDEPESFFKSADLFVLPSIQDGFGMVVLEAMACGVPVVVSQNVGAKDCVRHSMHDFIISPSNVDDLVEAMQFFYKNRDYKFRFVNELVSQAQKFSWVKYQHRFTEFIRQVN